MRSTGQPAPTKIRDRARFTMGRNQRERRANHVQYADLLVIRAGLPKHDAEEFGERIGNALAAQLRAIK